MLTWSTSMPRSASSSSTSRYDKPYRRYQRTASIITSAGKRKPAKAEGTPTTGRRRRSRIIPPLSPISNSYRQRNRARPRAHVGHIASDGQDLPPLAQADHGGRHPAVGVAGHQRQVELGEHAALGVG